MLMVPECGCCGFLAQAVTAPGLVLGSRSGERTRPGLSVQSERLRLRRCGWGLQPRVGTTSPQPLTALSPSPQ